MWLIDLQNGSVNYVMSLNLAVHLVLENIFLVVLRNHAVYVHPHAPAVAKRLREEFEKKDAKRCQYARVEVDVSQLYHGSNNHTPEVTPSRMTDPNEMRGTHVNSVSSTHPSGERNATM